SGRGPAECFVGTASVSTPRFQADDPAHVVGASVTFEPCARTACRPLRPGAARGRSDRGDPFWRRGLVLARREALAWRFGLDRHDSYRHPGTARWQDRRLDEEGCRRAIPQVIVHLFERTFDERGEKSRRVKAAACHVWLNRLRA